MRKFFIVSLSLLSLSGLFVFSQDSPDTATKPTIFDILTDNSDNSKGSIEINQDSRIKDLVLKRKETSTQNKSFATVAGFRVQVFSSNEQRTAKIQAYKVEEKIKEKFPELGVYVSYNSPFWKVRVGDCVSNMEAQTLRNDLKEQFPEFQRETYIVKDQVLVPE